MEKDNQNISNLIQIILSFPYKGLYILPIWGVKMTDVISWAISRFQEQQHLTYDDLAFKLIETLKKGLNNLEFKEGNKPEEISHIEHLLNEDALSTIQNLPKGFTERHEALIKLIANIAHAIQELRKKIDLNSIQANNFIFQAQHAFDGLKWFVTTDYVRDFGNYFNKKLLPDVQPEPASSPTLRSRIKPSYLFSRFSKRAFREVVKIYNKRNRVAFEADYLNSFQTVGKLLLENPSCEPLVRGQSEDSKKLKSQMKDYPIQGKQAQLKAISLEAFSKVMHESVDDSMGDINFNLYYTQIALFMKTRMNLEEIYQNTPDVTRTEVYSKYGFAEGASTEALQFFNSISINLGFNNSEDLYNNYVTLSEEENHLNDNGEWSANPTEESREAAKRFHEIKNNFLETYAKTKENENTNPLWQIEKKYFDEKSRIQDKRKNMGKSSFDKKNYLYLSSINYVTKTFAPSVRIRLKAQNIASQAIAPEPETDQNTLSFAHQFGLAIANTALPYLDVAGKVTNEVAENSMALEQMLTDASESVNQSLIVFKKQKTEAREKERNGYYNSMLEDNEIDTDKMITEYAEKASSKTGAGREYVNNFESVASLKILELNTIDKLKKIHDKINVQINHLEEKRAKAIEAETKKNNSRMFKTINALKSGFTNLSQKIQNGYTRIKNSIFQRVNRLAVALRLKSPIPPEPINILNPEIIRSSKIDAELDALNKIKNNIANQMAIQKNKNSLSIDEFISDFSNDIEALLSIQFDFNKNKPNLPSGLQDNYLQLQRRLLADQNVILNMHSLDGLSEEQVSRLYELNEKIIHIELLVDDTSHQEKAFREKLNQNVNLIEGKLGDLSQNLILKKHIDKIDTHLPHDLEHDMNNFIPNIIAYFLPRPSLTLNIDSLKKYYRHLTEKIISHLRSHEKDISIEDIEALYESVYRFSFEYDLDAEGANFENNPYTPLLNSTQKYIQDKIDSGLTHKQFEKVISSSTQHLFSQNFRLNESKKSLGEKIAAQQSWVSNPLGLPSYNDAIGKAENICKTNQALLGEMLQRNINFSKQYLEKLKQNPTLPSLSEIQSELNQLSRLRDMARENSLDPSLEKIYADMLFYHEEILKHHFSIDNAPINEALEKAFLNLFSNKIECELSPAPEIGFIEKTGLNYFLPGFMSEYTKTPNAAVLQKIRSVFALQEQLQSELLQKIPVDDPNFEVEKNKIVKLRNNLIQAIPVNQTQEQIVEQINKWDEEVENHFKHERMIFSQVRQQAFALLDSEIPELPGQSPLKPDKPQT